MRLLLKAAVFALIFLCLDQGFAIFHYHETNIFAKASEEKMKQAEADLLRSSRGVDWLFMGSSHAQFGFDTDEVETTTGRRAYNLGYGGGFHLGEQVRLLKGYLKRRPAPDVVVLAIDVFTLNNAAEGDGTLIRGFVEPPSGGLRLQQYRDWLNRWPVHLRTYADGRNILRYAQDCQGGKWTPPALREERRDKSELAYFSQYKGYRVTPTGFVSGDGILNREKIRYGDLTFAPRQDSVEALTEFVRVCRDRRMGLVVVQLPEHEVALKYRQKYVEFGAWMGRFADRWHVPYVDLDSRDTFPVAQDDLFFDSDHLNSKGAQLCARILLGSMRSWLERGGQAVARF